MTYLRFEPVKSFERLGKRFNEFANEFEKGFSFEMGGFNPRVNISEDSKSLYFDFEIPGIKKEDVKVSVNNENVLTIKGEKKSDRTDAVNCCRSERTFGEFNRSFQLPDNADSEKISAAYNNGILTLTIPKIEPALPKEIEVTVS